MSRIFKFFIVSGLFFIWLSPGLISQAQTDTVNLGEIRVVNALMGIGDVDIYLDKLKIAYSLSPTESTTYIAVPSGRHNIAVHLAGDDVLNVPIADIIVDLVPNGSQTAIVYQKQFATTPTENAPGDAYVPPLEQSGAIMVLDDNRSPTLLGETRLSAVHLAVGTPQNLSIAYTNRASLLHEIQLEKPYGSIDVESGNFALAVVDADSPSLNVVDRIGQISFQANTLYTMVIVPDMVPLPMNPNAANPRPQLQPLVSLTRVFILRSSLERAANTLQLRVIHAAHDTAVFDLYIDERLVAPRMNYSEYTEYLGLSDYSHTVTLRGRDASPTSQPIATARFSITEENRNQLQWTIMLLNANDQAVTGLPRTDVAETDQDSPDSQIINTPGGPIIMALQPDNVAQTQRGQARVRLVHAVDGALDISLFTPRLPKNPDEETEEETFTGGPTPTPAPPIRLVDPVLYGAEAMESETPGGIYEELNFVVGGTTDIFGIDNKPLIEGVVYTFVLIGQPAGEPPIQVLELENFGRGIPQERLYRGVITSTVAVVNIRERSNIQSTIQGQVENGGSVDVIGRNNNGEWVLIRYTSVGNGRLQEGWISAPLIQVTRLGDFVNILSLPLVQG